MSDDNNNVNSSAQPSIPAFVGQYRRNSDERIPQIVVIDLESQITKAEKRVCDFFKCTVNWNQNQDNEHLDLNLTDRQKCFATRHTMLSYEIHLKEKHNSVNQFFCIYCYHSLSNKSSLKTYPYKYLIKHMLKRHRFRRFQCNLCLYRAITEEHLIVHQKKEHSSEYSKAINNNSSKESICKILFCPKVTEELRNHLFYWNKYKEKRLNSEGKNETYFQCLYCAFMDELLAKVVDHCVERHPDYPLLYYIPEPQISSSTFIEFVNDFNNYDNNPVVGPKCEPQDNIVSSTQRSPETQIDSVIDTNDNSSKRRTSTENQMNGKRIRVDSSEESGLQTNINENNGNESVITERLDLQNEFQKERICLFCDQTFDMESDAAKSHLESHFDNLENNRIVLDWIPLFVNKQWTMASLIKKTVTVNATDCNVYYCPLCVKLAKIHQKMPKSYKTFGEVRSHLWLHCWCITAKCKLCDSRIANSDPIIAKHFKDDPDHHPIIKLKKFQFLMTKKTNVSFSSEQRSQLETKYIEVQHNSVIEQFIEKMLIQIKEDFENELRIRNNCDKRFVKPVVKRMSDHKFDKYFKEYQEYEQRNIELMCKEIDMRCEKNEKKKNKSSKKESKNSSKSKETSGQKSTDKDTTTSNTERVDRTDHILESINSMKNIFQEDPRSHQMLPSTSCPVRDRLESTESREMIDVTRDSDTDFSMDEEFNRISCYHCNDKFKTKRDFRDHSKKKHPNLPQRMYAKPRKQN